MHKNKGLLVLPAITNIEEIVNSLSKRIKLTKGRYTELEFRFIDNKVSLIHSGIDIKEYSNVWLSSYWESRDLAYAVALYLDHFVTDHTDVEKVTSKITDQILFTMNGIPMPNTFFINNIDIREYISTIESICSYPIIIKDITGAGGVDSVFINNRSQLIERSKKLPRHKKYLYQQFIQNDYDWGILVANGKVVSGEKSYPQTGEFRNNCNGATEVFSEIGTIPDNVKDIAIKASELLGLSWSRSDIIIDKYTNTPYLMEVNRCPGISAGTMEVIGAREFLEAHLKSDSRKINPSVLFINTKGSNNKI